MATDTNAWKTESLLEDSTVRLFGRVLSDLKIDSDRNDYYDNKHKSYPQGNSPRAQSRNRFLAQQLGSASSQFARIYCYSYQGHMIEMTRPAIFLVQGDGVPVAGSTGQEVGLSGVASGDSSFAPDVKMWIYDRADYTMRLDVESGSFDRVLFEFEQGGGIIAGSMQGGDAEGPSAGGAPPRRRRWRPS